MKIKRKKIREILSNSRIIRIFVTIYYIGLLNFLKFWTTKSKNKEGSSNLYDINNPFNGRVVIYTCIFGKIDNLIEPLFESDNIDYRIITDQEIDKNSKWQKISIFNSVNFEGMDSKMKNRYVKLFPNVFFKEYEYSIYIDGNIKILSDLSKLINLLGNKDIGIFSHPNRSDLCVEGAAVVYLKNAKPSEVRRQIKDYLELGFPRNFGMFENSLIVRKHNKQECINLMEYWWTQLKQYTARDQLSFMFSVWRLNYDKSYVKSLGVNIDDCNLIKRVKHKVK